MTQEASAEVARNTTQRNLTDKYGVTFSETGQMLGKNGEPVNLMDLQAEFTDKNNKKQTVQEALINMAKNASTDEEVQQVNQLLMMNGYSAEQAQAFAEFAQQNKGRLEQGLKKAALTSSAFSPEQKFSIAKDLGIVAEDAEYVDYKGNIDFINNLVEKGIDVDPKLLAGTPFEGKQKEINELVLNSREPKRKEGILRNLNSIIQTMVDEPGVGQQQYREYIDRLPPEDQRLVAEMGYSQNVVSQAAAKSLLEKVNAERKLNADILSKNNEALLKEAQAAYYKDNTGKLTEAEKERLNRAKDFRNAVVEIVTNEELMAADPKIIQGKIDQIKNIFYPEQAQAKLKQHTFHSIRESILRDPRNANRGKIVQFLNLAEIDATEEEINSLMKQLLKLKKQLKRESRSLRKG